MGAAARGDAGYAWGMSKTCMSLFCVCVFGALAAGCASESRAQQEPPAHIRAWMDRLTVEHEYDAEAGIIRARQVISVPAVIDGATPIGEGVARADGAGSTLIVFATADRCAPCQQYKKDALNDPRVIEAIAGGPWVALHIEVDRRPDEAERWLGGRAIPMTYALRGGEVVAELRGQRSAEDLLAWLGNL